MTVVSASALTIGYGTRQIVAGIELDLNEGESVVVIGHNGAGKTTLLRTLFGLQPALEGDARLLGLPVGGSMPEALIRMGVRYLAQGLRYFGDKRVRDHRAVLQRLYGFAVPSVPDDEISPLQRLRDMSVGQRRLEALHLLSAGAPQLFLLDEPTAGIDLTHTEQVLQWIDDAQARGTSFVVVEHNFERMLRICRTAMVIRTGKVTYYGSSEALHDAVVLARHYL